MYDSDPMTQQQAGPPRTVTLIRDMPETDRPRERLQAAGASALSSAELLAILLRTGSQQESALAQAHSLIGRFGGMAGLARASIAELQAHYGVGEAKAVQIKAALELGLRMARAAPDERPRISGPDDLADLLGAEMSLFDQEHLRVAMLDSRLGLMGIEEVYVGSVHTVQVRVAELLREAVRRNAPDIMLIHNHPSGDPAPSSADIACTAQLYAAARQMDINLLDHVIVAGGEFRSMRYLRAGFPVDGSSPALPKPPRRKDA